MKSRQRSDKRKQRFSEGLQPVVSKQQDFFTNSTAPLRETTKLETVGQIPTDKECIKCGVKLTSDNLSPSQAANNHWTCKSCYSIHNEKGNSKSMYVNGKYVSRKHPLYKAGKYKGFEDAAFSSLENFKDNPQGQVYVIANPAWKDWVKVGMAVDATDRAGNYQTSSPYRDYTLLYTYDVDDRRAAESAAHTRLAKECDNINEWFRLPPETANDLILEVIHEY